MSADAVSLLRIPENCVPTLHGGASFCIKMSLCWSEAQHLCKMNPSSSPSFECWAGLHWVWDMPCISGSQLSWLHPLFLFLPSQLASGVRGRKCLDSVQVLYSSNKKHPCVINTVFSTNPRHSSMQLLWRKFTLFQLNPAHCSGLTATDITLQAALWPHLLFSSAG